MTPKHPDVDAAYGLRSREDSQKLYASWAETYDDSFAAQEDYILHDAVAQAFAAAGGQGPVLDVGAGTGLCGMALAARDIGPLIATDISPEMLAIARTKGIYRDLFVADITRPLAPPPTPYAGIVSSGTFTTGHVGPEAIDTLLDVAGPGALLALSINAKHHVAAGFERAFAALAPKIADLGLAETRIYGAAAQGLHKDDTALIATFRKR